MYTKVIPGVRLVVIGVLAAALASVNVAAQYAPKDSAAPAITTTPTSNQTNSVPLSTGAQEILKLVQAKISEETIIAFINYSSRSYDLGASEVVYLRGQGASERVITAMLSHRYTPPAAAAPPAPAQPSTTQETTPPTYVQPSTMYVESPPPLYGYYYPYYGYYYPYYYPSFWLGFGLGYWGYHGHGYYGHGWYSGHGGYYGGHHGGNFHGGMGHGGHH